MTDPTTTTTTEHALARALLALQAEVDRLRELLNVKSHEAGLYARRMEQAQRSRDKARAEERAAVVAWLRHGRWVEKSVHMRHEYDIPVSSAIHDAADIIERGEHRRGD